MQPSHRPHEQLRTEAPAQRPHTDKYVSAFVGGKNNADLNFVNPLLQQSADHFKVGIDELTVNLSALSMLEYGENEVLFQILRRLEGALGDTFPDDLLLPDGPPGNVEQWRNMSTFRVDRVFSNMLDIRSKLSEVAGGVNEFIRQGLGPGWFQQIAAVPDQTARNEHFAIDMLPAMGTYRSKDLRPSGEILSYTYRWRSTD